MQAGRCRFTLPASRRCLTSDGPGKAARHAVQYDRGPRRPARRALGQEETRLPLLAASVVVAVPAVDHHRGHSSIGESIRLSTGRVGVRISLASFSMAPLRRVRGAPHAPRRRKEGAGFAADIQSRPGICSRGAAEGAEKACELDRVTSRPRYVCGHAHACGARIVSEDSGAPRLRVRCFGQARGGWHRGLAVCHSATRSWRVWALAARRREP